MKNECMVAAVIIAMFAFLLFCPPALADYNFDGFSVTTRTNGTVHGGVFIDYEPWAGSETLNSTFDVPSGNIKWAYLYTGIWGGTERYEGWVNVTFNGDDTNNNLGPIWLRGQNDTNPNVWCTGHGKHWMYYNVTNLTTAGSTNSATVSKINATDSGGNFDGRVYGIVLVVVYEGGDNPKDLRYWINDGSDGLNHVYDHDAGTTYFNGTVDIANVTTANLTMVHLTAYDPLVNNGLKFNGNILNTSLVDSNNFELNSWDVTSYLESSGNDAWYTRCGDYPNCSFVWSDGYAGICNAILVIERESVAKSDLTITAIKPYHYEWGNESDIAKGDPWFNLTNYVNVTVENSGTEDAGRVEVKLYADDELIGSETAESLPTGEVIDVKFDWVPEGSDSLSWTDTAEGAICIYTDSNKIYTLRAVVDEDNEVPEENEENNECTKEQKVVWNGYMADEPLETYAHDVVKGGILYTTGDGKYLSGCSSGAYGTKYYEINYTLDISGSTRLARLYIYYTWAKPNYKAPKMGVTIKTPSNDVYNLDMDKSYNDIKGDFGYYRLAWGTYAYNITEYVGESGIYVVNVTNLNDGGDPDFAIEYSFAAPAILVVYEDTTSPKREFWINEGADLLLGGRRGDGGFLDLEECKNTATFSGTIDLNEVKTAALGVVSPWGDSMEDDILYFNDEEMGKGVYCGYSSSCNAEIDGISMNVGARGAQLGIATIDIVEYLKEDDNEVVQGDEGDNMMPANAFLVITSEEEREKILDTGTSENPYPSIFGTHNGTITPKYNITVSRMYTYSCAGTGGHSEYIELWNATGWFVNASWNGYKDDWHNLSFDEAFTLEAGKTYNYTIGTGSYPQIHHSDELEVDSGIIRCTKFTDATGKVYYDWIPAIKLFL
jgi:hypothetical protein